MMRLGLGRYPAKIGEFSNAGPAAKAAEHGVRQAVFSVVVADNRFFCAIDAHALGLPNVVVKTHSIIALKSLVAHAGFLSWMEEPMFDDERRGGLIDALTTIRLLEELRQITRSQ